MPKLRSILSLQMYSTDRPFIHKCFYGQGEARSCRDALRRAKKAGDDTSSLKKAWRKYRADTTIETLLELRSRTDPYPQYEDTGAFCRSLRKMLRALLDPD